MKIIKLLMLFCIGAFFLATNVNGQANPTISVIGLGTSNPTNGGEVAVGAILNIQVTVGNTGAATVPAFKLRPNITVPSIVTILPDAQQTGLPAGWSIVSNTGSQIRICNGSDAIASGVNRIIIIKVVGASIGGPSTFNGQYGFGGTSCALSGGAPSGNSTTDDSGQSTLTVVAAPACALAASASAGIIACNGGTTTLTAATTGAIGTIEYSITGGAPFQTSNTFTVPAGTYTVTAREVATTTCIATATAVVIAQPSAIVANATSTPIGAVGSTNGSATAAVSGGTAPYTYSWNTTPTQTNATATGLGAGSYTVTVTDAAGCTQTASATVSVAVCNIAVSAAAGTIACNGGTTSVTATATGATGVVEYSLNGGAFQSSNIFTSVAAGSYTVVAREVANNLCSATSASVSVSQPAALVANATPTAILCNGGTSTIAVSATGGTAPYTGTGSFTSNAGAYSYTITDANGCTNTVSGTIAQPSVITVTAAFAPITVFGGTTTVNVSAIGGTAPYVATSIGAFVRADGTFTFTVTDANGCTGNTTITINPFSIPVSADPSVGQMNFTTLANGSQNANSLLFTQDYKLNIPFFNLTQGADIPNGTMNLKINLGSKLSLATGFNLATAPLNNYFAWTSATVADSVIITGTQIAAIPEDFGAVLSFNVKGRLSCAASVSTKINVVNVAALLIDEDLQNNASTIQYSLPVTVSATQVNVTCNGAANGIINAISSPGSIIVIRNSSNTVVTSTGLIPGVYTVTATATGDAPLSEICSNVTTITIVQPTVLVASSTTNTNNTCNAGTDGKITASSTGGTAPYSYVIAGTTVNTTGATSGIFTSLAAGIYTITSTDAKGCTATTTSTVTQPLGTAPNLSLGSDITSGFFAASGVSQTIVYNIAEIAGNPAVGDTIRITKVAGFDIGLNTATASTMVGSTNYLLDNARWKIDNTNALYTSIILTNPLGAGPGTILCNQRLNVAVTITRNTIDVTTFTLSARLRRANGELVLTNNLNSIIMTAE